MTRTYRSNFGASWFAQFMAAPAGRTVRIVAGLALIGIGIGVIGGIGGWLVAAVGLVPLLAGTLDVCVFSALFGGPFAGSAIRACRVA